MKSVSLLSLRRLHEGLTFCSIRLQTIRQYVMQSSLVSAEHRDISQRTAGCSCQNDGWSYLVESRMRNMEPIIRQLHSWYQISVAIT